jgi:hypothetical protein
MEVGIGIDAGGGVEDLVDKCILQAGVRCRWESQIGG